MQVDSHLYSVLLLLYCTFIMLMFDSFFSHFINVSIYKIRVQFYITLLGHNSVKLASIPIQDNQLLSVQCITNTFYNFNTFISFVNYYILFGSIEKANGWPSSGKLNQNHHVYNNIKHNCYNSATSVKCLTYLNGTFKKYCFNVLKIIH